MAHDAHLREKAIQLRTEYNMTLDDIIERLQLPRTTIYGWIKDIPIPRTEKQSQRQKINTARMKAKYAALREEAYQRGLAEAPTLLQDVTFRDFVVLYMAEGYKRGRNQVSFVNSDAPMMKLANRWICLLTERKIEYQLQYHADHDVEELQKYWAELLNINPQIIKPIRKSNSNSLKGRQFRSVYGILTVRVGDTYLRSRLQAWMDVVKSQW
jgi:hypothetical protein